MRFVFLQLMDAIFYGNNDSLEHFINPSYL